MSAFLVYGLWIALGGQVTLSGGSFSGSGSANYPAEDLTTTATEACGYDDDSSEWTPVDIGQGWFVCTGFDANHTPYTATVAE